MLLLGKPCEDETAQVARAAVEATRYTSGTGFRFPASRRNAVSAPVASLPATSQPVVKKDEAKKTKPLPQIVLEPDEGMEVITDWDGPENLETSDLSAPSLMRAAAAQAVQKAPIEPLSVLQQGPPTKASTDAKSLSTSVPYPTTPTLAKQARVVAVYSV